MSTLLPRFYFGLLAVLCVANAWQPLSAGDDLWAHAAIGRWISQNQSVPTQTLFLWSVVPISWIYHSWLSQLTFFQLLATGPTLGPLLVLITTCLIIVLVFWLLWRLALSRLETPLAPLWLPPIFALAITISALRFRPRPELFTALFLCVLLLLLAHDQARKPTDRVLDTRAFLVVLLFALWANFHGAVAIGLLIVWATALCDWLQDVTQTRRISLRARRHLMWALLASAAIGINPYGLEYWQALKPVSSEVFHRIDEWKPFWQAPVLNPFIVGGQLVLVAIGFFAWLGNSEGDAPRRWAHLAWLLLMSCLFLSARRHLWLLPIVCLVVIGVNARTLSTLAAAHAESVADSTRVYARVLLAGVLIVWIAATTPQVSSLVVTREVPLAASRFLQTRYLGARVFNDYENSSYLQWQLAGTPPLYIDLLNAYPESLVHDYLDIVHARPRGLRVFEEQNIEVVILRKYQPESVLKNLGDFLDNDVRWQRVYDKDDSIIWARRDLRSINSLKKLKLERGTLSSSPVHASASSVG